MPISAELYEQIRKLFVEGVSMRGIARELGCSKLPIDLLRLGSDRVVRLETITT